VVGALLIASGLIFLAEGAAGNALIQWFALWPLGLTVNTGFAPEFHPWQLLTYGFLHGGVLHLALNMYALWLFGAPLERRWGSNVFLAFFITCIIGAGLMHLIVAEFMLARGFPAYPVIGASGGVFGLLLAFGYRYPNVQLFLLFPPVPIRARWFVIGYGAIELIAGVTGTASGVAHFAHLGGMLTGYLLIRGSSRFW
jgi:membrane associated rhomboid family serine protease